MSWIRLLAWLASAGVCHWRAFAEHSSSDALSFSEQRSNGVLGRSNGRESRRPLTQLLLAMVHPGIFRNAHTSAHGTLVMMTTKTDPSSMRMKELKAELDELGVQWKGKVFDKDGLVSLLIEARERPPAPSPPPPPSPPPYDPDVVTGQTQKMPKQGRAGGAGANPFAGNGGNPFGGPAGGANPFGGGMGGNPFAGAAGGGMGGNPFGGAAGGASPFGGMGGMGGMQDMIQKVMSNPKAMALMQKAQSNPKFMQAMQEMQQNPAAAAAKYQSDPEVQEFITEVQKIMGM